VTRVFDCFTFHDEFELLRGRVALLDGVVDCFVIAEATTTFTGRQRDLALHGELLAELGPKVHVVVVSDAPDGDAWGREHHQRRSLAVGLREAGAACGDVVIISDVDEMPNPEVLEDLRCTPPSEPVALSMRWFNYCMNLEVATRWSSARATRFAPDLDLQGVRAQDGLRQLGDAGWHLSYLGGSERARQKLADFSHQELAGIYDSTVHLERCVRHHVDLLGRYRLHVSPRTDVPDQVRRQFAEHMQMWAAKQSFVDRCIARGYRMTTAERTRIGPSRCDRHPLVAWALAGGIVAQRRVRLLMTRPS
jgi:beta-1,4-mannosyl-glycoprotein beta-1,4-N-acetylglucosaminyltransferase